MKQIIVTKELASVGLRVVGREGWEFGDQDRQNEHGKVIPDATGIGSITDLRRGDDWIRVKWDSGFDAIYPIGGISGHALCIYSPMTTPIPSPAGAVSNVIVTEENAKVGMRVKRGRDWRWDDQDIIRGKQAIGEIKGVGRPYCSDGWVQVFWDGGNRTNNYRIGGDGSYDLYMYSPSGEVKTEYEEMRLMRDEEISRARKALDSLSGSIMKEKSLKPNTNEHTTEPIKVRRPISTIKGPNRRVHTPIKSGRI